MESENYKIQNKLSERLLNFAVQIIKAGEKIGRNYVGRQIFGQLVDSSTSAGANCEEACGAESRSDFVHKLQIVLKELRESLYWLRLIEKVGLLPTQKVGELTQEGNELANIIAKSILTAKKDR